MKMARGESELQGYRIRVSNSLPLSIRCHPASAHQKESMAIRKPLQRPPQPKLGRGRVQVIARNLLLVEGMQSTSAIITPIRGNRAPWPRQWLCGVPWRASAPSGLVVPAQ
jgi:hypothetical protein